MPSSDGPGALAGARGAGIESSEQPFDTKSTQDALADFAWLANLSPTEYEFLRRPLAREYGFRVSTLDRLYREAQRQARLGREL